MGDLFGIGSAVGGVAQGLLNYAGTVDTNKTNAKLQREINEMNQKNFDKQFAYQKYLNENQHQIESKDLLAAGINPIVGAGGQLQGFSASPNVNQAAHMEAPNFNGIGNAFSAIDQMAFEASENEKNRESAENIAEINAKASGYSADKTAETADKDRDFQIQNERAKRQQEALISANKMKLEKQLAKLDRKSREKIASEANKVSKEIANLNNAAEMARLKASQDFEVSDRHFEYVKKVQGMLEELQEDLQNNARENAELLSLHDVSGRNLQSLMYDLQKQIVDFMTDPDQRLYENILKGVNSVSGLANGIGSIFNILKPDFNMSDTIEWFDFDGNRHSTTTKGYGK